MGIPMRFERFAIFTLCLLGGCSAPRAHEAAPDGDVATCAPPPAQLDPGVVRDLQSAAAKSKGTIYSIMTWMNARGLSPQTVAWADSLPAPVRSRIPVPLAFAEACMLTGDWKRLRTLVTVDDWGDVDFLRFAFHARVLDETAGHVRRAEFRGMWERATNATRSRGDSRHESASKRLFRRSTFSRLVPQMVSGNDAFGLMIHTPSPALVTGPTSIASASD